MIYPCEPKYGAAPIRAVKVIPTIVYHFSNFFLTGILSAITPSAGAVSTTNSIENVKTQA